jgi:hypothetical protein
VRNGTVFAPLSSIGRISFPGVNQCEPLLL